MPYGLLKEQLDVLKIDLVDTYGVIGTKKINTLEYLGIEYDWSVYSPTLKSELLEAERSHDEIRDIMSRMIGAQIRYCRMGYWVRGDLYGLQVKKTVTPHGKRSILVPIKHEATLVEKMFNLRAEGKMEDNEIIELINSLGFKSHIQYLRAKNNPIKITGQRGGEPLKLKSFMKIINNPVYAGINVEKWTNNLPIKLRFDGLVSPDLYNRANRGKFIISEAGNELKFLVRTAPEHLLKKGVRNVDFPYKKVVLCPVCKKPLHASASRGKLGKYYPAYHCRRDGHNFRVPKEEFEQTIERFVKSLRVTPERIKAFEDVVMNEWYKRTAVTQSEAQIIDEKIAALSFEARQSMDKIKYLTSETAIKYIEEELIRIEAEVDDLNHQKATLVTAKPIEMEDIMRYAKYFFEHLDYLLLQQSNPVAKANFFSLIFEKSPTYADLEVRTPEIEKNTGVSEVFLALQTPEILMARAEGFEPPNASTKNWCLTTWRRPMMFNARTFELR